MLATHVSPRSTAHRLATLLGGILISVALLSLTALPALAHQEKDLGDYHVEVGFQTEPAIVDQMNALEFIATTKDGKGVEGLEKTVRFEVQAGGKTRAIDITPVEGDPGHYLGAFMPTLIGDYVFHMAGKINDLAVDEKFESGPNRFSPVTSGQEIQFPNTVPPADEQAAAIAAADARASQAQTLGVIGIAVGAIGIVLAGVALLRRRN